MSIPLTALAPVPNGPLRLFAVMSDANKGEKTFSPRLCHLYIKGLEIISGSALTGEGSLRMAVRLKGKSNIINAIPSVVVSDIGEGEHPMDVVYSLQYMHNIKGIDIMEIILTKKKNAVTSKTVAITSVNLQALLQRPFSGTLTLMARDDPRMVVAHISVEMASIPAAGGVFQEATEDDDQIGNDEDEDDILSGSDDEHPTHYDGVLTNTTIMAPVEFSGVNVSHTDDGSDERPPPQSPTGKNFVERVAHSIKNALQQGVPPTEGDAFQISPTLPHQAPPTATRQAILSVNESDEEISTPQQDYAQTEAQLEVVLGGDNLPPYIVLASAAKRREKKFVEWGLVASSVLRKRLVFTSDSSQVEVAVAAIISKYHQCYETGGQAFRLIIVGSDSYVSDVLRSSANALAQKPRGWELFQFGIVPVGHNCELAQEIAATDATYRSLFFSSSWIEMFDSKEALTAEQGSELDARLTKYFVEARQLYQFPIGEALLTQGSAIAPRSVPFIKGVEIGTTTELTKVHRNHVLSPDINESAVLLQLDYWVLGKKEVEVQKVSAKIPVHYLNATRLASVSTHLLSEPVGRLPKDVLLLVGKTVKEKKNPFSKTSKPEQWSARIQKLICSPADEAPFLVTIDGTEWRGVKFVSLAPQWMSNLKAFPVAMFASEPSPTM